MPKMLTTALCNMAVSLRRVLPSSVRFRERRKRSNPKSTVALSSRVVGYNSGENIPVFDGPGTAQRKAPPGSLRYALAFLALVELLFLSGGVASASTAFHGVERKYVTAPSAPKSQSDEDMRAKSEGCQTCHTQTDAVTIDATSLP